MADVYGGVIVNNASQAADITSDTVLMRDKHKMRASKLVIQIYRAAAGDGVGPIYIQGRLSDAAGVSSWANLGFYKNDGTLVTSFSLATSTLYEEVFELETNCDEVRLFWDRTSGTTAGRLYAYAARVMPEKNY